MRKCEQCGATEESTNTIINFYEIKGKVYQLCASCASWYSPEIYKAIQEFLQYTKES